MYLQSVIKPVDFGTIPEPAKSVLDNGTPLFVFDSGTEEVVRLDISFGAGSVFETVPLAATTSNLMLMEGCKDYSAVRLSRILDFYGVYHNLYCERDRAGIVVYIMNKHLGVVLELLVKILFEPLFLQKELKALLKKQIRQFLVSREKVQVIASDQFFESIFGSRHPYGRQIKEADFANILPEILINFHNHYYRPENMTVIASGKITAGFEGLINSNLGSVRRGNIRSGKEKGLPTETKSRIIHIEKKNAVQSSIKIGSRSINKTHNDYPLLKIVTTILGGYFGSRLMKNLREEKGYTYGVSSSVVSLNLSGYKIISTDVSNKFTQFAVDEVFNEIRKLQTLPVGKDELEMVRNYMLGDMIRMFDGPFALADSFRSVLDFGLDNSYYYRLADKIKTVTPGEIIEAARTYYNIDDLYQITAG